MVCARTAFTRGAASKRGDNRIGDLVFNDVWAAGRPSPCGRSPARRRCPAARRAGRAAATRYLPRVSKSDAGKDQEAVPCAPFDDSARSSHAPFRVQRQAALMAMHCSVLARGDGHLPCSAGTQVAGAFIEPAAFVAEVERCFHRRHSHGRHGWHEENHGDFRSRAPERHSVPVSFTWKTLLPLCGGSGCD